MDRREREQASGEACSRSSASAAPADHIGLLGADELRGLLHDALGVLLADVARRKHPAAEIVVLIDAHVTVELVAVPIVGSAALPPDGVEEFQHVHALLDNLVVLVGLRSQHLALGGNDVQRDRSEEHTSELQSLMRI